MVAMHLKKSLDKKLAVVGAAREQARRAFDASLDKIGKDVLREVVIPVCKVHGLVWSDNSFYIPSRRGENAKWLPGAYQARHEGVRIPAQVWIILQTPLVDWNTADDDGFWTVSQLVPDWGPDPYTGKPKGEKPRSTCKTSKPRVRSKA